MDGGLREAEDQRGGEEGVPVRVREDDRPRLRHQEHGPGKEELAGQGGDGGGGRGLPVKVDPRAFGRH